MKSRLKFLSDPEHRIRFLYTPKHSSWMNQVEFSILGRKMIRRASFSSTEKFIDYFNRTMAKPFKWTYEGRALQAS